MTNYLLQRFVPDWQAQEKPTVRSEIGCLAGLTGMAGNGLLFGIKLAVGLLSGSIAIVADGVNNLSDMASSAMTLLGFWLARRPADEEHPYGHARYEYLAGLAVAVLVLVAGVKMATSAVEKLLHPESVTMTLGSFLMLLLAMGIKGWLAHFFSVLGNHIQSAPLKATAMDSRNDIVATGAVLAGQLVEQFLPVYLDGWIGLAVAALIFHSGWCMAKEAVSLLLGRRADATLVARIVSLIGENPRILGYHDLLVHDYGPGQCFASVHIQFAPAESAVACHAVIDAIERRALQELNVHLVAHFDPEEDEGS